MTGKSDCAARTIASHKSYISMYDLKVVVFEKIGVDDNVGKVDRDIKTRALRRIHLALMMCY